MIAPAAIAFVDDLSSRHRRTQTAPIRPVDAVLRARPAPLHIDHRVFVDARSWRMVAAAAVRAATAARRAEPAAAPVAMQIIERLRRADGPVAANRQPVGRELPVAERLRGRGEVDTPPVRGVPMVLARQAAPAESRTVTDTAGAADGWPPSSPAPRHAARHAQTPPALAPVDVNLLTERVVAAIDRRMVAARERMGL